MQQCRLSWALTALLLQHVEAIPEFSLALEADLTKQQEHDALVERASALTE